METLGPDGLGQWGVAGIIIWALFQLLRDRMAPATDTKADAVHIGVVKMEAAIERMADSVTALSVSQEQILRENVRQSAEIAQISAKVGQMQTIMMKLASIGVGGD